MAVKSGVENPTHTGRVVHTGQGDQPGARAGQGHITGDQRLTHIRRVHINKKHLRPVQPDQGNGLHPPARHRDDMKTRLLANQIDNRLHNFGMAADNDDAVVWNNSPPPRSNNTIEDRGNKDTKSSYQKPKFGYVNCAGHINQTNVIHMNEKARPV
jgi:hypothetical protein